MNVVALVSWLVVLALLFALQEIGMAREGWPTMSDMFRSFMRPLGGRWLLFGLWLWLGWHLFIRGWEFFLQEQL